MQEFAIHLEKSTDAQKRRSLRELERNSDHMNSLLIPTVSNLQSKVQNPNFESSTQGAKFEAVKSELQWRLCHAQLECQDCVYKFAEFRSQVSLLASERHRAQKQAVLLVSEDRERDQGHQQEVTQKTRDLEQTRFQMQNFIQLNQEHLIQLRLLLEETSTMRAEPTETGKESQSIKDSTASEHSEEIYELRKKVLA